MSEEQMFKARFYKVERVSEEIDEPLQDINKGVSDLPRDKRTKVAGGYRVRMRRRQSEGRLYSHACRPRLVGEQDRSVGRLAWSGPLPATSAHGGENR